MSQIDWQLFYEKTKKKLTVIGADVKLKISDLKIPTVKEYVNSCISEENKVVFKKPVVSVLSKPVVSELSKPVVSELSKPNLGNNSSSVSKPISNAEKLTDLKNMFEEDLITQEEYTFLRKEVLAKM